MANEELTDATTAKKLVDEISGTDFVCDVAKRIEAALLQARAEERERCAQLIDDQADELQEGELQARLYRASLRIRGDQPAPAASRAETDDADPFALEAGRWTCSCGYSNLGDHCARCGTIHLVRRTEDGRRGYMQGHAAGKRAAFAEAARLAREKAASIYEPMIQVSLRTLADQLDRLSRGEQEQGPGSSNKSSAGGDASASEAGGSCGEVERPAVGGEVVGSTPAPGATRQRTGAPQATPGEADCGVTSGHLLAPVQETSERYRVAYLDSQAALIEAQAEVERLCGDLDCARRQRDQAERELARARQGGADETIPAWDHEARRVVERYYTRAFRALEELSRRGLRDLEMETRAAWLAEMIHSIDAATAKLPVPAQPQGDARTPTPEQDERTIDSFIKTQGDARKAEDEERIDPDFHSPSPPPKRSGQIAVQLRPKAECPALPHPVSECVPPAAPRTVGEFAGVPIVADPNVKPGTIEAHPPAAPPDAFESVDALLARAQNELDDYGKAEPWVCADPNWHRSEAHRTRIEGERITYPDLGRCASCGSSHWDLEEGAGLLTQDKASKADALIHRAREALSAARRARGGA